MALTGSEGAFISGSSMEVGPPALHDAMKKRAHVIGAMTRARSSPTTADAIYFAAASLATAANDDASTMASSDRILRSSTTLAFFRPLTRREYDVPLMRAAALMRVIHRRRKSRFLSLRLM